VVAGRDPVQRPRVVGVAKVDPVGQSLARVDRSSTSDNDCQPGLGHRRNDRQRQHGPDRGHGRQQSPRVRLPTVSRWLAHLQGSTRHGVGGSNTDGA